MAKVSLKMGCMVVMMCMAVLGAPMAEAAMTCGAVTQNLMPCLPYLRNGESASSGCCAGVKNILGAATTTSDRQTLCNCLKAAAASIGGINDHLAQQLPSQCHVSVPYKISTSTNCATIKF